jgi:DNA polymerase (family 10)
MTNAQVSVIFKELADLLIQKKENWFKIRAYRKVAEEIEKLPVELSTLANDGRLREIPGVGEAIEKKVKEILTTGRLQLMERVKAEMAEGKIEQSRKQ